MAEALISRRGGGGSLKYATGVTATTLNGSRREVTVSGLDFKPYIVIGFWNSSGDMSSGSTVACTSFASLDGKGNPLLSLRGPDSSSASLYIVDQTLTDNGFTLQLGKYTFPESQSIRQVTWYAWGL